MTTEVTKEMIDSIFAYTWPERNLRPDFTFKVLSRDEAQGFASYIVRAIFLPPLPDDFPSSIIIKIPILHVCRELIESIVGEDCLQSMKNEGETQSIMMLHRSECRSYELLKRIPIEVPKIYAQRASGGVPMIVMEDIANAHTKDVVDGLSEKQIFIVLDQLSTLQAYSQGMISEVRNQLGFMPEETKRMADDWLQMIQAFSRTLENKHPVELEGLGAYCERTYGGGGFMFDMDAKYRDPAVKAVWCHGDMWTSQILWDNDEPDRLRAIVDWQIAHAGNPAEDIHRLMMLCLSVEQRRTLTGPLLRHLQKSVAEKAEQLGHEVPYTLAELRNDYIANVPMCTMIAIMFAGMVFESPIIRSSKGLDPEADELRVAKVMTRIVAQFQEALEVEKTGDSHFLKGL